MRQREGRVKMHAQVNKILREGVAAGRSVKEIAQALGASVQKTEDLLLAAGLRRAPKVPGVARLTREFLEREYVEKGKTLKQIAEAVGVSNKTVERQMRSFGIARQPRGVRPGTAVKVSPQQSAAIRRAYERGDVIAEIAKRYGISRQTVY